MSCFFLTHSVEVEDRNDDDDDDDGDEYIRTECEVCPNVVSE